MFRTSVAGCIVTPSALRFGATSEREKRCREGGTHDGNTGVGGGVISYAPV